MTQVCPGLLPWHMERLTGREYDLIAAQIKAMSGKTYQ